MGHYKKVLNVYQREVLKRKIKTVKNEELNAYITIKQAVKLTKPCYTFINGRKITLYDKGYTILEYSPLDKYYNCRVFIDDKDNILLYYFDMVGNFDIKDGEVYYNDMYLDVIYNPESSTKSSSYIHVDDDNELEEALNTKEITKEQYDLVYKTGYELIDELKSNTNKFVNRGIKDYLDLKD